MTIHVCAMYNNSWIHTLRRVMNNFEVSVVREAHLVV
jgi:hypothetical protein